MKAQAKVFVGARLEDKRADVVFGLQARWNGFQSIPLPGDPPNLGESHVVVAVPDHPRAGRLWVGVELAEMAALPKSMAERVWSVDDERVVAELELPPGVGAAMTAALPEWNAFAKWCANRGVELDPPACFVVAD